MFNMIILIILIIVLLLSFNLFRNLFKSDVTILDDVKLKEEETNNNGFALMLETENVDGTTSYVESNSSSWPIDMKFNSEKSGCVDVNNNIIEDALSFDTNTNAVTLSINKTAYCYVYFDIKETLSDEIMNNSPAGFNTTLEGGLYRYQGTNDVVTNNYICFGTSDKDICVNNIDTYMYRIIGIDENGQTKLIKNTSIGYYMWHSDDTTNTSWPESDLYKGLNGIDGGSDTDLFINSSTYTYMEEDSNWYNKIVNYNWKYGDTKSYGSYNGAAMYAIENGWTDTINAKIGLMYIHDYYYAYGVGGNPKSRNNAKTAWVFLGSYEWTISRYGYDSYILYCSAWYVDSDGDVSDGILTNPDAVRPVFFLASDIEYSSGTGTIDDPFVLKKLK